MNAINTWTLAAALSFSACAAGAAGAHALTHSTAPATAPMDHSKMDHDTPHAPPAPALSTPLTFGEIRKIDTEQGKLTIKHAAILHLDMPPMTMVFRAAKPELLAGLKPGDKIRFHAESAAGSFSVTRIEKAD